MPLVFAFVGFYMVYGFVVVLSLSDLVGGSLIAAVAGLLNTLLLLLARWREGLFYRRQDQVTKALHGKVDAQASEIAELNEVMRKRRRATREGDGEVVVEEDRPWPWTGERGH